MRNCITLINFESPCVPGEPKNCLPEVEITAQSSDYMTTLGNSLFEPLNDDYRKLPDPDIKPGGLESDLYYDVLNWLTEDGDNPLYNAIPESLREGISNGTLYIQFYFDKPDSNRCSFMIRNLETDALVLAIQFVKA